MKSTNSHVKYWKDRKIDWEKSYFNVDHPHRDLIIKELIGKRFVSIFEPGCASGANLYRIKKQFPNSHVGGMDVNQDAIETARKIFGNKSRFFEVGDVRDLFLNDKSLDALITDMTLIYMGPRDIHKAIKEIRRVTRHFVVLVEFHHKSFWKRWAIRLKRGYNAYDYKKLLRKYDFHDIKVKKIPEEFWPGGEPQKTFGYVITAKL